MKFFSWMHSKFNGGDGDNKNTHRPRKSRLSDVPVSNNARTELPKEEFIDWPHGLLAIGTFGNTGREDNDREIQVEQSQEIEIPSSTYFSEFTAEEVGKLIKELKKLLARKPAASRATTEEQPTVDLPLDRFLNFPSSSEVGRTTLNRYSIASSDDKGEDEIDRTIRIILGRCKDVCAKKKAIGKKSISFLFKKMFACRSGFVPTPNLRDSLQESRMEKLLRTMLAKKIHPQNAYRSSSIKRYIEDDKVESRTDESHDKSPGGSSKWDKTDSEFIVLEI